ncbi:MAG: hypothetical protein LAN63_16155 [Acidobacteriia bacterium]|nr:hypothetical protein [Terriglobia bacterium]
MKSKPQWIGLGVALGAGLGAALGVATHQMGPWLVIGIGIGLAIANAMADRRNAAACGTDPQSRARS